MRRRKVIGSAFAVAVFLLILAGAAFATVRYDDAHEDELLPGVTVGGVDGSSRRAGAVVRAVDARLPRVGATALRVVAGPEEARVALDQLGLRSDAAEAVARARADADRMGMARRVWHRLLDKPVHRSYHVRLRVERSAVKRVVADLARQVELSPVDAKIDTSTGFVRVLPASNGRSLDVASVTERVYELAGRVANGTDTNLVVEAPPVTVKPKVTGFADVLLVRLGENKLYHYENGALVKAYTVSTGTAAFPTPKGNFSIVLKRRNPTWVNPDPKGWGASLPPRIGPGPGNPLGTRAMNLNAPGIRIHGTSNVASLGRSASHGCIRMSIPDVEELFDKVDQTTPVAIIQGPRPPPAPPVAPASPLTVLGDPNAPVDLEAG